MFELASGGTLFLDEIGDMPMTLQVKMLRVLQERKITRLGGTSPIPINARIIAATNKKLEEMVHEGSFREDLFYRLNVVRIELPPLRGRYNLQKINNLHSRLKGLLAPFRGVSTKYLDNYLAWNGFEAENPGVDRLDLKKMLLDRMQAIGRCSTYLEVFHKPPLPFPVAG